MKSAVFGFVLIASFLVVSHAFPGASRESVESVEDKNDGVVLVLPARRSIFDDESEDDEPSMPGLWHPFRFDSSHFDNLFTRMQETMNRISAGMAASLAAALAGQNGQGGQTGLTPLGKIPEGANTTSTTKVIGDHSVTINETTYTDGDENGGIVFRVRVVDVKPLNETIEAVGTEDSSEVEAEVTNRPESTDANPELNEKREELTTPSTRSVETVEEFDNEIHKSQVDTLTA